MSHCCKDTDSLCKGGKTSVVFCWQTLKAYAEHRRCSSSNSLKQLAKVASRQPSEQCEDSRPMQT